MTGMMTSCPIREFLGILIFSFPVLGKQKSEMQDYLMALKIVEVMLEKDDREKEREQRQEQNQKQR